MFATKRARTSPISPACRPGKCRRGLHCSDVLTFLECLMASAARVHRGGMSRSEQSPRPREGSGRRRNPVWSPSGGVRNPEVLSAPLKCYVTGETGEPRRLLVIRSTGKMNTVPSSPEGGRRGERNVEARREQVVAAGIIPEVAARSSE